MSHKSPGDGAQLHRRNYSLKSIHAHTHTNWKEALHTCLCTCNHNFESNFPQHVHMRRLSPTNMHIISKGFSAHLRPRCSVCILISAWKLLLFVQHKQRFKAARLYTAHQKCQTQSVKKIPCSLQPPLSRRFSSAGTYSALIALMVPAERRGVKCFAHRWKSPGLRLDSRILYC